MAFIPTVPVTGTTYTQIPSAFISTYSALRCTSFRGAKPCVLHRHSQSPGPLRVSPAMQVLDVKTFDVFMPALSSTMSEGRIVQWLKQPGDPVEVGDPLMVVESDKADMDVESFEKGFLASILVEEGNSCEVGNTVGIIVQNKEDIEKVVSAQPATPASADPPTATVPVPSSASPVAAASVSPVPVMEKPPHSEVFMPALSSTMTEGKVVEWLKNEGDPVDQGEMVMVVESDKADMDVESFEAGFLAHIAVNVGETCPVGEPVAFMAKSEGEIPVVKAWATAQASGGPPSAAANVAAPAVPVTPVSTNIPAAVSQPALIVNEGRIIASPLAKVAAKEFGVDLRVVLGSGPGGRIVEADVMKAKDSGTSSWPPTAALATPAGKIIATPDAKKIAKKEKIDLSTLSGTGNFGRITAEDVLKAAGKVPVVEQVAASKASAAAPGSVKTSRSGALLPAGAVAMSAMQKAVVQNMTASLTVPVFRLTYKIKTAALDDLYSKVKPKGVTMSALLAKVVALALMQHPIMNATYADNSIVYRPEINIAMAVAMNDGGLITPTLMAADKTDLYSLSRSWKDLVKRALDKKLSPDEYNSGTFFVSNLGMFGVDQFDAILPPGAPGILAIGASQPVVVMLKNGLIGVEKEMKVTLTADHRHIYGADGAKFLKELARIIEEDVTALLM